MSKLVRLLETLLLILYPLLAHLSVYKHSSRLACIAFAILLVNCFSLDLLRKYPGYYGAACIAAITLLAFAFQTHSFLLLYFPPIMMSAFMLVIFARTLLPKREAFVTTIARVFYAETSLEVQGYTRTITKLWCVFFAAMLIESILLSLFASMLIWSLFCNILNYAFIALFFLGEYFYRQHRFPHAEPLLPMLKKFSEQGVKQLLKAANSLPLMGHTHLEDIFARDGDRLITCAQFLEDASTLAQKLPRSTYIINLCQNRYHFVVLFAAALLRQKVTILPHQDTPHTLQQLQKKFKKSLVMRDQDLLLFSPATSPSKLAIPHIEASQLAAILYTSGSTGEPKPWKKYWGTLVKHTKMTAAALNLKAHEKFQVVATVAPQHMYGFEHSIILPLQLGYVMHAAKPFFGEEISEALNFSHDQTICFSTPLHLKWCAESELHFPKIHSWISATAKLSKELALKIETRFGAPLIEIYGSTETGCIATRRTVKTDQWTLLPDYHLVREDHRCYVITEEKIELLDDIEILEAHHFLLRGRLSENINIAGKRMSLSDLTLKLTSIPGVQEGVFYQPPGEQEHSRLVAFVVAPTLSEKEIQQALRSMIDPVFLPRPLIQVEKLPRNHAGKIQMATLENLLKARHFLISSDHPSLAGHFPSNPIVPGVVILAEVVEKFQKEYPDFQITEIPKVKFIKPLEINMPGEILFSKHTNIRTYFSVTQNHLLIASGSFSHRGKS